MKRVGHHCHPETEIVHFREVPPQAVPAGTGVEDMINEFESAAISVFEPGGMATEEDEERGKVRYAAARARLLAALQPLEGSDQPGSLAPASQEGSEANQTADRLMGASRRRGAQPLEGGAQAQLINEIEAITGQYDRYFGFYQMVEAIKDKIVAYRKEARSRALEASKTPEEPRDSEPSPSSDSVTPNNCP